MQPFDSNKKVQDLTINLLKVFIKICEENKIPKVPNDLPHVLLLQLFDEYDDNKYNHIKQFTSFHKLSYKQDKSDMEKKNTFYDVIINQNKY